MALGIGEGGELQAPLARVVVGGLTTSTLITLVFIPGSWCVATFTAAGPRSRGRATRAS
jgi:HAE1 family hydrophobic/amphiphilic exporter-1